MWTETGFPRADVENEFLRLRRRQFLSGLIRRARHQPDEADALLRFDDVVEALGRRGERQLGLQIIRVDSIVGSLEARRDFDRQFRPTSSRVRFRWEQLALAQRRGAQLPPIEVYRVGTLHFLADGHHRVSIARATHQKLIDAYVTQIFTELPAETKAWRPADGPRFSAGCLGRRRTGRAGTHSGCPGKSTPREVARF